MGFMTEHLEQVGETYPQHFCHAISFAGCMLLGSLACLAHAILPFLFVKTGSGFITRLHERMVINRLNLTPPEKKRRQPTAVPQGLAG